MFCVAILTHCERVYTNICLFWREFYIIFLSLNSVEIGDDLDFEALKADIVKLMLICPDGTLQKLGCWGSGGSSDGDESCFVYGRCAGGSALSTWKIIWAYSSTARTAILRRNKITHK